MHYYYLSKQLPGLKKWPLFILITSIFFMSNAGLSQSGSISIETSVDTTTAYIGNRILLEIKMLHPQNTSFILPKLDKKLGDFIILDQNLYGPDEIDNHYQSQWQFNLTVFDTGLIVIPSIKIQAFTAPDTSNILTFYTDSLFINILSVLPGDAQAPRDIKAPFPIRKFIPWDIVIFVLALLLIITGWFFYQRHWKKTHPVIRYDEKYLEPPHVIAIKKLNSLKKKEQLSAEEKKNYYSDLSEIIREYLERRYFIRALEMSSFEINEVFSKIQPNTEIQSILTSLFNELDLVKFAKFIPEDENIEKVWNKSYNFIEKTKHDNFLKIKSILENPPTTTNN